MTGMEMAKQTSLSFLIKLYLLTAISFLLLAGCLPQKETFTQPTNLEERVNRDNLHTNLQLDQLLFRKIRETAFYEKVDGSTVKAFFADCRGDEQIELAIASSAHLFVYSLDGEVLLQKKLPGIHLRPALTQDIDYDTKADIIFGSENARINEVRIVNGMGYDVSQFTEKSATQNFSALIPIAIYQGSLLTLAQPEDYRSPRGILKLDAYSLDLQQTFFTPFPLDLTFIGQGSEIPDPLLILSYRLFDEGQFQSYGLSDNPQKEVYEAKRMLLKINIAGMRSEEMELSELPTFDSGTLFYTAIPNLSEEVLLFYTYPSSKPYGDFTGLYKISLSNGKILEHHENTPGTFYNARNIPVGDSYFIIMAVRERQGMKIHIFSSSIELLKTIEVGQLLQFGPSLLSSRSTNFMLFFITEDGLYVINSDFEIVPIAKKQGLKEMAVYAAEETIYAALVTETSYELFSVNDDNR
jgi:hypothetical protein